MSKQINVNPGQYKVAGRDRAGEPLGQQKDRAALSKNRQDEKTKAKTGKKR